MRSHSVHEETVDREKSTYIMNIYLAKLKISHGIFSCIKKNKYGKPMHSFTEVTNLKTMKYDNNIHDYFML